MNKRGVYFFILDAFLGASIVVVSLMIIIGSFSENQVRESPMTTLEDLLTYLQVTEVRDFDGNFTRLLLNTSNVTNPDNSLFEQIAYQEYLGDSNVTRAFLEDIMNSSLPKQMSLRYYYNDVLLYEKQVFPWSDAGLVLSSKKVSMVTVDNANVYGPHLVEVVLWTS